MAENEDGQEKTEDATDERKKQFRDRGEIAVSKEFTSVMVLASVIIFFTNYAPKLIGELKLLLIVQFEKISSFRVNEQNFIHYLADVWGSFLYLVLPVFMLTMSIAVFITFSQTKLNFSMKRMKPNFQKFNILKGVTKLVSPQSAMELTKGILKMSAVGLVSYLILRSEWIRVPGLMNLPIQSTWKYWGTITQYLFWSVAGLLLLISGADYLYNFISLENKMKMTKKEVKDEYKNREVDPHLKGRMRRMQRDILNSKQMVKATEGATVVLTNPTHYSIAIKYEIGMPAPMVVAKGVDHLALKMREAAKAHDIPLVENKPLARAIYKIVEVDQPIPESLYKAISEIIRYVFKIKGVKYTKKATA